MRIAWNVCVQSQTNQARQGGGAIDHDDMALCVWGGHQWYAITPHLCVSVVSFNR